jgi:hypothetical protein
MEIVTWILSNKLELINVATAIVAAASAVAALTPTPKDNGWAAKAYKIIDWLALNVGKAKDK